MADVLVRELSEETVWRLRQRAEEHGRSIEAESRTILENVVGSSLTIRQGAEPTAETSTREADTGSQRGRSPTLTAKDLIEALQRSPLAEVGDEIWGDILNRRDRGRSFEW